MLKPLSAIAAVLFAAVLVAPTVSYAEEVPSATVSYADLNLSHAKGQQVLRSRIDVAATSLCDFGAGHRELQLADMSRACRTGAIASAQRAFEAAVAAARRPTVTVLTGATLTVSAR